MKILNIPCPNCNAALSLDEDGHVFCKHCKSVFDTREDKEEKTYRFIEDGNRTYIRQNVYRDDSKIAKTETEHAYRMREMELLNERATIKRKNQQTALKLCILAAIVLFGLGAFGKERGFESLDILYQISAVPFLGAIYLFYCLYAKKDSNVAEADEASTMNIANSMPKDSNNDGMRDVRAFKNAQNKGASKEKQKQVKEKDSGDCLSWIAIIILVPMILIFILIMTVIS